MDNQEKIINELIQVNNAVIDQIQVLTKENSSLKKELKELQYSVEQLMKGQKSIVNTIFKNQQEVRMLSETMTRSVDNIPYEIGLGDITVPRVATIKETVDRLANSKASICRFGDGEFSIMMGCSRQGFQHQDDRLAKRLIEVVNSEECNCLIAIADNYGSLAKYSNNSKNEIRYYMTNEVREGHMRFLRSDRIYYNAYITTPYMLYADRDTENPLIRFNALKAIWKGKAIIIVEGCLSRLGVGNDLFAACDSIQRILCPAEHAFDCYDAILEASIDAGNKIGRDNVVFVIALGPTATVLAFDLYKQGFQAMDLGHVDNDYEYFLHHATERYAIPGKYVNNITRMEDVSNIKDDLYAQQIVKQIFR